MHQKAVEIRIKNFGETHTSVALSYNNMDNVYNKKGKLGESLEMHQKALEIRAKNLGEEHSGVADSYNNIGSITISKANWTMLCPCNKRQR